MPPTGPSVSAIQPVFAGPTGWDPDARLVMRPRGKHERRPSNLDASGKFHRKPNPTLLAACGDRGGGHGGPGCSAFRVEGLRPTLSGSIADAAPDSGITLDSITATADEALYRAKKDGRDRIVVAAEVSDNVPTDPAGFAAQAA